MRRPTFAVLCFSMLALGASELAHSQVIDFETLPGGPATTDLQLISNQYSVYGVTFTLLDRTTGAPIGSPRIAKAGAPQTAFEGCLAADTPEAGLGLGTSFLTDGTSLGVQGDLRIDYATGVSQASGVIIDVDCRVNGGAPCEQWTITAYDAVGTVVQTVVLDAPQGAINPACISPEAGPGDAKPMGWVVTAPTPVIRSIVLRYTGAPTDVGLAFDNFSVASLPGPPDPNAVAAADTICPGEFVELTANVAGGLPPYTYQWEQEAAPNTWSPLGTNQKQAVHPGATTRYRARVTDALGRSGTTNARTIAVATGDPLCSTSLLVSSSDNDRVVRYSFRSGGQEVLVSAGAGGLNVPSDLACRADGRVYVVSQATHQVLRYDAATGAFENTFVSAGSGGLNVPVGMAFGPDGHLYVASYSNDQVLRYDGTTGAFLGVFVPATAGLNGPTALVFGPDGHLYVSSRDGDKVMRFDGVTGASLGAFVTAGSGGLDAPRGLAFGPDGHLYVGEEVHDSVRRYDGATGAPLGVFVAAGSGGLDRANDVAFGPDGNLYVASYGSDQVLVYDGSTGAYLRALATGLLSGPAWLALDCGTNFVGVPVGGDPGPRIALAPGAPNPFRGRTTIEFVLPSSGPVSVAIVDVAGRVVTTLSDGVLSAGRHVLAWDAKTASGATAPAGAYFVRVRQGSVLRAQKLLLIR